MKNNNTCDFRVYQDQGEDALSAVLCAYGHGPIRHGILLDSSYNITGNVTAPEANPDFNMHELNVLDNGRTALHLMDRSVRVDVAELDLDGMKEGWILDTGFRELNVATGETEFEWWASEHVSVSESKVKAQDLDQPYPFSWNWFHGNSINKNEDGDYLLSSRFADCIYKISGKDGAILWRLGGVKSSFNLDGFNFSRQHDAQWLDSNGGNEVISFLDNASDLDTQTSSFSSALIVELDKTTMTAHLRQRFERPDRKLSRLRGNFQHLPTGNFFATWSDNAVISEHDAKGCLLMEAHFQSERFVTYRAYTFEFKGSPNEPPVLKAFAFGADRATSTTVYYVSWNGATEVAKWRFFSKGESSRDQIFRGDTQRTGFETTFHTRGYYERVFAEAIDADGSVLGTTDYCTVTPPGHWKPAGDTDKSDSALIDPDHPTVALSGMTHASWLTKLLLLFATLSVCAISIRMMWKRGG